MPPSAPRRFRSPGPILLTLSLAAVVLPCRAQNSAIPSECTPEMIAQGHLALSRNFLQQRVVRCADGTFVLGPNATGIRPDTRPEDLIAEVQSSPTALGYARSYQRRARVASIVGQVAIYSWAAFSIRGYYRDEPLGTAERIVGGVSFSLLVASFPLRLRANRQRARAVAAYNDSLPR